MVFSVFIGLTGISLALKKYVFRPYTEFRLYFFNTKIDIEMYIPVQVNTAVKPRHDEE